MRYLLYGRLLLYSSGIARLQSPHPSADQTLSRGRKSVRKADLLITVETTEQAMEASDLFFQYYRENANYLERSYDFVERLGIEKIRKETVYAPEVDKQKLLDRLARSKALAKDAWLEGETPVSPTQFVQIQLIKIQPREG